MSYHSLINLFLIISLIKQAIPFPLTNANVNTPLLNNQKINFNPVYYIQRLDKRNQGSEISVNKNIALSNTTDITPSTINVPLITGITLGLIVLVVLGFMIIFTIYRRQSRIKEEADPQNDDIPLIQENKTNMNSFINLYETKERYSTIFGYYQGDEISKLEKAQVKT
ncbi:hypothetical protein K502DRAFT_350411 [Neoconidiobolus thromboides FSU 785]|nr:hypothetical protein K502DRAFT_350411 [Neoconidiobolus thromboides FSU 785]